MVQLVDRVTAAAVAAEGGLSATLRAIVAAMAREGQRGACVALVNARSELYIAAWDGDMDERVRTLRLPLGKGIMGRVAAEGRPIVVADLDNPGPVAPANRNIGTNALTRSAIAVPIWFDGVVIGVLEMGGTRRGQFGDRDVILLEAIAATIAEAVRRIEPDKFAAEVLRHRVRELAFLQEAAASLATSLEVHAVASAVVRSAARGTGGVDAMLLRLRGNDVAVLAAHAHPHDPRLDTLPLRLLPWLAQVTRAEGATVAPRGVLAGELAALLPGADSVTAIRVAVGAGGRGVLLVAAEDDRGLDPAQIRLIEGLGNLAGLALANAESFERQCDAARRDWATGLLNRSELERRMAAGPAAPYGVLAIDVDNLRVTNEAVGHHEGDITLRMVAAAMQSTVAQSGIADAAVARTGGDEFGVLLPRTTLARAAEVAEQIRLTMHGIAVPHGIARISAGCAAGGSRDDDEPRRTWDVAVAALHRAKQWGRDRVEVATGSSPADSGPAWETVLIEVLARHAMRSVYQPIVRLGTREPAGCEALARPLDATAMTDVCGLFSAAQAMGMTRDLDWLCRRTAVHDAPVISPQIPLFVNVGVWTLLDPLHDVDQMLLLLRWAGRSPDEVVLEITEREVVSDVPRLRAVMAAYRQHGFRFALDDVGEGHSTLEILAAGRPEFVKLARTMVATATEVGSRAAIQAVIAFAAASGSQVIAEGIETVAELDLMTAMGIPLGQGFLLGRPAERIQVAATPSVHCA